MNRSKLLVPVIACLASLYAAGCVVEEQTPIEAPQPPPQPVEVQQAPPPDQYEVIPVAPRREYVWVRGHWDWSGARYVWIPGRYEAPRRGMRWIPAHYESRGGRYFYVRGHWAR